MIATDGVMATTDHTMNISKARIRALPGALTFVSLKSLEHLYSAKALLL
jgi:hypothetical protein